MNFLNLKIYQIIYFIVENVKRDIVIEEKEKKNIWN